MNFRELLQTEIWSERTTRKLRLVFGIGFGLVVVVACSLYWFDTRWLSSGERKTGRVALAEIDTMQNWGSLSDEDYQARCNEAKAKVESARQAAFTSRDSNVALLLDGYLMMIDANRSRVKSNELLRVRHIVLKNEDPKFIEEQQSTGVMVRDLLRVELHTVLD